MLPRDELAKQIFDQLMAAQAGHAAEPAPAIEPEPGREIDGARSFVDYRALTGQTRASRLLPSAPFPRRRQGLHHGHFRRADWSRCRALLWSARPGPEWLLQIEGQKSFRKACHAAITGSLSRSLDARGLSEPADASFDLEALVRSLKGRRS